MTKRWRVAIAGATGAVGTELMRLLEERAFPLESLTLLASERSAGRSLAFGSRILPVSLLDANAFADVDIAFFSAGATRSRTFAPAAVRAGAIVIDNSSAFRMDEDVPLVVPEINAADIAASRGIVANPNCSTILLLMAIAPLIRLAPIRRVVVSTYQAASGAGAQAMQELLDQTHETIHDRPIVPRVFPWPIAFNLFSHNTPVDETGYNDEERKMIRETRKILHDDSVRISATCVRVPVLRAHSESINLEFADGMRPNLPAIRQAITNSPGLALIDDRAANHFPMPVEATGRGDVLVGRLRDDLSNHNAIEMFVSGDQILKGAALNAVQIAEHWMAQAPVLS
ncbi:MAG: aspartate-semialdehyde dehydrogenase [Armatimonadetes bacterium]|nr:aspartate-semialdehyde dehydrogenase [Armatimonadota bacterium]MDE2206009.1 aspartate-semialdehyde dehydrogenase [Armatimonadota bacterium]